MPPTFVTDVTQGDDGRLRVTYGDGTGNPLETYTYTIGNVDKWGTYHYNIDPIDYTATNYVSKNDLSHFERHLCKKIYEIISTHTYIDITEEEFMKLLELE